jgi:hypothetical protein
MSEDEFLEHMTKIAMLQKEIDSLHDQMHREMLKVAHACIEHIRRCP